MCSVCATVLRCVRCGGVGWQILLYLVIHQYRIELVGKIGVPMVKILVIVQQLPFRGERNESPIENLANIHNLYKCELLPATTQQKNPLVF